MTRIILVDSDELGRLGLRTILEQYPALEVVGDTSSQARAVELAKELNADIVVTALKLKDGDGFNLSKTLAELTTVRVVVFTLRNDDDAVFEALDSGARAYVLKETEVSLLVLAIQAVSQGAFWLDPSVGRRVIACRSNEKCRTDQSAKIAQVLTPREREVLNLICDGHQNKHIAGKLFVSTETVKTHVRHLMEKLQVRNRTELAAKALQAKVG